MSSSETGASLRISEIFYSLQGETSRVGLPTVFVRLTGCPLRCQYCDTAYAFTGGQSMTLQAIIAEIRKFPTRYVTVTGGEPLAQKNSLLLMKMLFDEEYRVSLETSGALDISAVDERVMKVMDIKTPASGEASKNLWENLQHVTTQDEIKFVLCNEDDYDWSRKMLVQHELTQKCDVLFSPAQGQLLPGDLADWILRDHLQVRMQLQLHKILWGNVAGR
ncbi:MAG: 7-carboxy-7-deazaguanine synthase QueE [Gallionellaceae bacterium]